MDSWSSGSSFIISVMWSSSMMWWWWCWFILYVYYVWTELADMITAVLLTSVTAGSLFGGTTQLFTLFIILYLSFHPSFTDWVCFFSPLDCVYHLSTRLSCSDCDYCWVCSVCCSYCDSSSDHLCKKSWWVFQPHTIQILARGQLTLDWACSLPSFFFSLQFCHRWSFGSLLISPLSCLVGDTEFLAVLLTWLHRHYPLALSAHVFPV